MALRVPVGLGSRRQLVVATMEQDNRYYRESVYKTLLSRLLRSAKRNSEAEPDNEYYSNAVEVLEMLSDGFNEISSE